MTTNCSKILKIKILLFFLLAIFSCHNEIKNTKSDESEEYWNSISNSNDYLVYQEFINKFPESEHLEQAIDSLCNLRLEYWQGDFPGHCTQNCILILLNQHGQLLFNDSIIKISSVKDLCYTLLANYYNDERYPEKVNLNLDKNKAYSRGHFVVYAPFLNENNYLRNLIIEIKNGIYLYKQDLANNWYNNYYDSLNIQEKQILDSLFLHRITVFNEEYTFHNILPPPPSVESEKLEELFQITDTIDKEQK